MTDHYDDFYEYSDAGSAPDANPTNEPGTPIRAMSPSELQIIRIGGDSDTDVPPPLSPLGPSPRNDGDTSEGVLYDADAFWNVLPERSSTPAQNAGHAARLRARRAAERWRGRSHGSGPVRNDGYRHVHYVPDAFDGKSCRAEMYGFKDEAISARHSTKFAAESFIREFASRNGVNTTALQLAAPCSGAGDVRVVYADEKHRIILRAM